MKVLFLLLLIACGKPITEKGKQKLTSPVHEGVSEELLLDTSMSMNFDFLPLEGHALDKDKLWSGDSWKLKNGAINFRWNDSEQNNFAYYSPGFGKLKSMSAEQMKKLSPSEKFDIFMGRYDYPLRWEVDLMAQSGIEDWEGLCHGWAAASINYKEPTPIEVTNPDGIKVYFGASDIKALLTYAYSKVLLRDQDFIGKRCEEEKSFFEDDRCNDDLSALSFHVVLTNKLGLRGQSFIADLERYKEVWNHPIKDYESTILSLTKQGDFKVALIETKLGYVDLTKTNSWEKQRPIISSKTVKYELTMTMQGNLLKGRWISKERPDFIWTANRIDHFDGYLSQLVKLLR